MKNSGRNQTKQVDKWRSLNPFKRIKKMSVTCLSLHSQHISTPLNTYRRLCDHVLSITIIKTPNQEISFIRILVRLSLLSMQRSIEAVLEAFGGPISFYDTGFSFNLSPLYVYSEIVSDLWSGSSFWRGDDEAALELLCSLVWGSCQSTPAGATSTPSTSCSCGETSCRIEIMIWMMRMFF